MEIGVNLFSRMTWITGVFWRRWRRHERVSWKNDIFGLMVGGWGYYAEIINLDYLLSQTNASAQTNVPAKQ
jgi:hypothetical protein